MNKPTPLQIANRLTGHIERRTKDGHNEDYFPAWLYAYLMVRNQEAKNG